MGSSGKYNKDVWHREAASVALRNAITLRRWGMRVTVYTGGGAGEYVLTYGLASTLRSDNNNWLQVAAIGATWGGGGGGGDVTGPAVSVSGNFVSFSGTTGKIIQDSGKNITNLLASGKGTTYNPLGRVDLGGTYTGPIAITDATFDPTDSFEINGGGGGVGGGLISFRLFSNEISAFAFDGNAPITNATFAITNSNVSLYEDSMGGLTSNSGSLQLNHIPSGGNISMSSTFMVIDAASSQLTLSAGGQCFQVVGGKLSFFPSSGQAGFNWGSTATASPASLAGGDAWFTTTGNVFRGRWGSTTMDFVGASNVQTISNKTLTSPIINVGSDVTGDVYQRNGSGQFARLAAVATGNALISGGVGVVSSWGKIGLTTHVSGILPVANGGTATATPSLVAGLNIAITGTWPNQTVAHSGILAVANGGTGTATPNLVAGLNIAVTGTWPNQTIAHSGILAVANGGTGTATPGLVAGTNVTITGTWPNQTINASGGGGGITNSAANTELMKSDGTNAVSSKIFVPSNGDLTLGDATSAGPRTLTVASSAGSTTLVISGAGPAGFVQVNGTQFLGNNTTIIFPASGILTSTTDLNIRATQGMLIGGNNPSSGSGFDYVLKGMGATGAATSPGRVVIVGGDSGVNAVKAGQILISSGSGGVGNTNDSGDLILDIGTPGTGGGVYGNISFFNSTGSFGGGEKITFQANSVTPPGSSPTGGYIAYTVAGEPWVRTSGGVIANLLVGEPAIDDTGTAIQFDKPRIYGGAGAVSGNITLNTTGLVKGLNQLVIHNQGSAPSFGGQFHTVTGTYVNSVDNYIMMLAVSTSLVLVSIYQ